MEETTQPRCIACNGIQERVIFSDAGKMHDWRVSKVGRRIRDAFAGKYKTEVHSYVCTGCGRITFYVANLQQLLVE